jgi:S-adenosylmethionine hydrolase
MEFKAYVLANQEIVQRITDRLPGDPKLDMYYGTLDYATSRFNTIILKLSQDQILAQEHAVEVMECFEAIQAFYSNVKRYEAWPKFFKHIVGVVLHGIGTRRIPKIKRLLERVNN